MSNKGPINSTISRPKRNLDGVTLTLIIKYLSEIYIVSCRSGAGPKNRTDGETKLTRAVWTTTGDPIIIVAVHFPRPTILIGRHNSLGDEGPKSARHNPLVLDAPKTLISENRRNIFTKKAPLAARHRLTLRIFSSYSGIADPRVPNLVFSKFRKIAPRRENSVESPSKLTPKSATEKQNQKRHPKGPCRSKSRRKRIGNVATINDRRSHSLPPPRVLRLDHRLLRRRWTRNVFRPHRAALTTKSRSTATTLQTRRRRVVRVPDFQDTAGATRVLISKTEPQKHPTFGSLFFFHPFRATSVCPPPLLPLALPTPSAGLFFRFFRSSFSSPLSLFLKRSSLLKISQFAASTSHPLVGVSHFNDDLIAAKKSGGGW